MAALAAEELNSFYKDKQLRLEGGKPDEEDIKKEKIATSEDEHFKDKLARTHRVVPGSTSLSRPFLGIFLRLPLGQLEDSRTGQ